MMKNSLPTNKETRELLKSFKAGNRLRRFVVRDLVEDSENYNGENLFERLRARLQDVSHGCQSGTVGYLVYYSQTSEFFKKYKKEIKELCKETADNCGESLGAFLSGLKDWDEEDPFIEDVYNKNTLAWFAYEETAYQLDAELENLRG